MKSLMNRRYHPVLLAILVTSIIHNAQAAGEPNKKYSPISTDYAVPTKNVLWVNPDIGNNDAAGTKEKPLKTIHRAVQVTKDGATIVLQSGAYREPHFFITKNNITLQAEPHGNVWIKGSDVIADKRWQAEGNLWKVSGDDLQNFCHVCTLSADPDLAKMSAYPEQVFINDEPLTQVKTKAEVKAGTFFVEDKTPTTLKSPKNNRAGYNIGAQDSITYYLGSNPHAGTVEISQRARAFTVVGRNFSMKGINVAQYSPNQVWGFNDPKMGDISGPVALAIVGDNARVENGIFTQNTSAALAALEKPNIRITQNKFIDNGGSGAGGNRANNLVFANNFFSNNNIDGYPTNGSVCGAYCGLSHLKVTHVLNLTFRDNIVDDSKNKPAWLGANTREDQLAGFWCDEGCINTKVVNNFFTNVPTAIIYEVSDSGIIASNIIENSGTGIGIAGSSNTRIYNNTISRTFRPIILREDTRIGGCNHYANGKCQIEEGWSKGKGLSWDLTGLEFYNNIISSRAAQPNDGAGPYWAYPIRMEGDINQDGKKKTFSNDMFKGLDYNAYYRSNLKDEPVLITWDLAEIKYPLNILFTRASDLLRHPKLNKQINGLERHALDLFGTRAENPYFMLEASANDAYRQSNYHLRSDSPARGSGRALPLDIARAIDPSGGIKPGVAVDRGALKNILMDATNGASSPHSAAKKQQTTTAATSQSSAAQAQTSAVNAVSSQQTTVRNHNGAINATTNSLESINSSNSPKGNNATANTASATNIAATASKAEVSNAVSNENAHYNELPPKRDEPQYDRIQPYSEGMAAVEKSGRWGFINQGGREVVRPQYDDAWSYREGRAAVARNNHWGYIDQKGREIVSPHYDQALPFGETRAAVKKNGQWGFIDSTGKEIVKPQYDKVWPYKDGRANVIKNGHRTVIDLNGNEVGNRL
ncbi:MAG: WG repeat-containing protein [Cardiobacteriaceae bacterium]|nr:WG repeat-containing protein [Cardiobacteriaceae bacterium]